MQPGIVLFVVTLWLGMLIGVSFIATPVKFKAPALDYAAALDVGRVTFSLFGRIEWGLCAVTALAVILTMPRAIPLCLIAVLVISVAVETFWLRPELVSRVLAVLEGQPKPPSWVHAGYVGLEAAKALALVSLVWISFRQLAVVE